jgi:pimeloyl-ACP methyl ester carboxylesterase
MAEGNPTVVLVHGAWHGPWAWAEVASRLAAEGIGVQTVDLPSVGPDADALGDLHDDAATVRATLDEIDGPVVLVAHSYGGAVASEGAAGAGNVEHIVYLTAFMLDEGESLYGLVGGVPPDWWEFTDDRRALTPTRPEEIFYNDLSPEEAESSIAALQLQSFDAISQELRAAAWKDIPSTYVICDQDNAIPVPAQEMLSQRAGTVHRLDASHSPMLSQPDAVVEIIRGVLP